MVDTPSSRPLDNEELTNVINLGFVLICGFLCFLLQAGFGLLEVGSVRRKNAKNIMLKNTMDAAVSALAYWAVGFAFAYGTSNNGFIGNSRYFLMDEDGEDFEDYVNWFFQWVFAGTTATIVSGAVAERCRFRAYMIYSAFLSGFVYPVVCHWIWDPSGFLYGKVMDFSGSGAVHLVGGAAAMAGAWILGPRIGRFVQNEQTGEWQAVEIPGHNAVLAALGTLVLWFGFFPFNAGAGYAVASNVDIVTTGRAVVVTNLAAASGGCALLFYGVLRNGVWDPAFAMNGLLGGMVASCSGVNVFDTWSAIIVGILGALGFYVQVWVFETKLRIDDPLNASPLHMGSGIMGMLAVGFLANDKYVASADEAGLFFGGNGKQLGYQVYGTIVYFAWAFGTSALLFYGLKLKGWLRVSEEAELMGMDQHEHAGFAYIDDDGTAIVVKNPFSPSSSQTGGDDMLVKVSVKEVGDTAQTKKPTEERLHSDEVEGNPANPPNQLRQRRVSATTLEPGHI
ncbi:hypothetical protein ACA910_006588 [Epithemia clementina (nom. ined.)]